MTTEYFVLTPTAAAVQRRLQTVASMMRNRLLDSLGQPDTRRVDTATADMRQVDTVLLHSVAQGMRPGDILAVGRMLVDKNTVVVAAAVVVGRDAT